MSKLLFAFIFAVSSIGFAGQAAKNRGDLSLDRQSIPEKQIIVLDKKFFDTPALEELKGIAKEILELCGPEASDLSPLEPEKHLQCIFKTIKKDAGPKAKISQEAKTTLLHESLTCSGILDYPQSKVIEDCRHYILIRNQFADKGERPDCSNIPAPEVRSYSCFLQLFSSWAKSPITGR